LAASDWVALLEITNRRRGGGVLALASLTLTGLAGFTGLTGLLRRAALFEANALRFDIIKFQTKIQRVGSE